MQGGFFQSRINQRLTMFFDFGQSIVEGRDRRELEYEQLHAQLETWGNGINHA
jgi:hypothetical protein